MEIVIQNPKIEILVKKKRNFRHKLKFCAKIEDYTKKKIKFWSKNEKLLQNVLATTTLEFLKSAIVA